jgi:hypothetical protein
MIDWYRKELGANDHEVLGYLRPFLESRRDIVQSLTQVAKETKFSLKFEDYNWDSNVVLSN